MSISRKAEKRQKRKEKKKQQIQEQLSENKIKFNIINLLSEELLDTKPNMAKFLKEYVESIRCLNDGKIKFYPYFKYQLSKIFVKFLDGHELIYDMNTDGKFLPKYCLYFQLDEIQLKNKDIQILDQFFENLLKFKFVY